MLLTFLARGEQVRKLCPDNLVSGIRMPVFIACSPLVEGSV
jgi:hypothetical protein